MKKHGIQDERVLAQHRKINSEAYGILMIALAVSIIVQEYFLNAPFQQYVVEVICFIGVSLYTIGRYLMRGLNLYGEEKQSNRIVVLNSIVTGLIVTAINGVFNYMQYAEHYKDNIGFFIAGLAITFISATLLVFLVLSCMRTLNKKKQEKIQRQLDEQEDDE